LDIIADVKADDPETVIFKLKNPSADFPYVTSDYHLPIFPAKEGGGIAWQAGQGAGPFILQSFEPGVRANAVRNPNYHKPDAPYFDAVELLVLTDVTARTNALTASDIDYMERVDLKTIGLLEQNPKISITNITGLSHYVAPMNVTAAPFDNADVRLALKWAIDREEIVEKVLQGYGSAGNDNPMAPSMKFAATPEPVFRYDPERARFHLKKAGFDSLKVDFSVSDAAFAGAVNAGLLMQNSAKAANIDINVIREPEDAYWDNVWMKKPWSMSFWSGRPTADWLFATTYASEAEWNETFWKHPRFNELLLAARQETDDVKRQGMYTEMQQILHDEGGQIVLMFNNFVSAHANSLAHNELNSNYDHDGRHIYERWWFTE
jgi:peptide/nickel transport system substrate-binding protein